MEVKKIALRIPDCLDHAALQWEAFENSGSSAWGMIEVDRKEGFQLTSHFD